MRPNHSISSAHHNHHTGESIYIYTNISVCIYILSISSEWEANKGKGGGKGTDLWHGFVGLCTTMHINIDVCGV